MKSFYLPKGQGYVLLQTALCFIKKGPGSQPQSTLSCGKKTPTVNKKFLPPLNLVPKNRVDHSFQNCCDTWSPNWMVWLLGGCLCQQKRHKMQILFLVSFKSSTLSFSCSCFVHQELTTYSALFVLCRLGHLVWFQGF